MSIEKYTIRARVNAEYSESVYTTEDNHRRAFNACMSIIMADYFISAITSISRAVFTELADGRIECTLTITYDHGYVEKLVNREI